MQVEWGWLNSSAVQLIWLYHPGYEKELEDASFFLQFILLRGPWVSNSFS